MQWETKKGDPAYVWQWRLCLGLRCHAATKRLAACEEREAWKAHVGFVDCGADCRLCKRRTIWSSRSCFNVGELIPQSADPALIQSSGGCGHEGMCHSGARAVCEHEARSGPIRQQQEARDDLGLADPNRETLRRVGFDLHVRAAP
jgi:hypothetical protein